MFNLPEYYHGERYKDLRDLADMLISDEVYQPGWIHYVDRHGNLVSEPGRVNGAGSAHWYLNLAPGFGVPAPC
jgi:hypothetical protein